MEISMQIGKIYKTNILFAVIYFITVLLSTLLVSLLGEINLNNLMLRTVLCFFFSILMLFISIENYKNGKQFVNKKIKSKIVKVAIVFYYLYIFASCILYIYESIAQYKANGAYIMVAATTIMLDVVNRSIHKENFDNSKMV
jgi:cobalamin synthase